MAHDILRTLLHELREAQWFSLIADETRDISGSEKLSVSLRWVEDNYTIHEDLVGLMEVEMTNAETLTSTIKDLLLRCNLQLCHCRGQAYDGASNMAGHISGVSTRITAEKPRALYVHCLANSLNLCLQGCSRYCDCMKNALSLASDLATVTCQKFKYNFTHFKDCHVTSAICYTVYSKDSLFNSLKNSCYKT